MSRLSMNRLRCGAQTSSPAQTLSRSTQTLSVPLLFLLTLLDLFMSSHFLRWVARAWNSRRLNTVENMRSQWMSGWHTWMIKILVRRPGHPQAFHQLL